MWSKQNADPTGGKRLLDYDCKVRYGKDELIVPKNPKADDIPLVLKKAN